MDVDRLQRELEAIFGARRVSLRAIDLETYARDMWPRPLLAYREGQKPQTRKVHAPALSMSVFVEVQLLKSLSGQRSVSNGSG